MCTQYWIEPKDKLGDIVEEMNHAPLMQRPEIARRAVRQGLVRPTDVVPAIAPDRYGKRAVFPMKWGFTGKTFLLNARSETAAEKPTFCEAWRRHRCILPASWYFEWEHIRQPDGKTKTGDRYRIRPKEAGLVWLCGLYRIENGIPVFVVLTRQPGESVRFLHDRMPLILPQDCAQDWILPDTKPEGLLDRALTDMEYERPEDAGQRNTKSGTGGI